MFIVPIAVTPDELDIAIRDAGPEDEAVVMSSWLRGHRDTGDWPPRLSSRRYFGEHKLRIEKILASAQTKVACNPKRLTQVFGYIVYGHGKTGPVLHWIYVKQMWRGMKVARALLDATVRPGGALNRSEITCSHWTLAAQKMVDTYHHRWRYNPFLIEAYE